MVLITNPTLYEPEVYYKSWPSLSGRKAVIGQSVNKQFIDDVISRYDICIRSPCKYHTKAGSQLFRAKTNTYLLSNILCWQHAYRHVPVYCSK